MVRVGLIDSAATEVASASIAAGTMDANLGDETFTRGVFIEAPMSIIPGAAILAAFAALTSREVPKSPTHVIAVAVSAVVMAVCLFLAHRFRQPWLKEWGLGISSPLVGLVASCLAHYAGLGAPED